MQIHHQELPDVNRYIDNHRHLSLDDKVRDYEQYMRLIRRQKEITPETAILEIGTGTGWFPLLCARHGIRCKGLEISPQLVEYARQFGEVAGLDADIALGNIEDDDIGVECWDVIVAMSVFEHIEKWEVALQKIYRALKPGGVLLFESTSKFSFTSGEFSFPLYGWLPNNWRYGLRIHYQGEDIMDLGIDFHQFTYPALRRAFRRAGFLRVDDRLVLADPGRIGNPVKRVLLRMLRGIPPVGRLALTFMPTTNFVCVK